MIVIAGLPSSGNYLVCDHVKRGVELHTKESVQVWHGDGESPNIIRPSDERLVFVVPVRSEPMRLRSVQKRRAAGKTLPLDPDIMRRNVIQLAAANGARLYSLSYEGLVQNPEAAGRNLFQWLGLPWVPWPIVIYDANKAHQ